MKQSDLHNKQANKNLQELKTFVWGYRNLRHCAVDTKVAS